MMTILLAIFLAIAILVAFWIDMKQFDYVMKRVHELEKKIQCEVEHNRR